jgi:hypothetical protein
LPQSLRTHTWTPISYWLDDGADVAETADRQGTTLGLEADHRRHAEVENTIRDLKYGVGLNHLPSGKFAANAAWLTLAVIAHNLARWTSRIGLGETLITTKTLRTRSWPCPAGSPAPRAASTCTCPRAGHGPAGSCSRWTGCAACHSRPDPSSPPQHARPLGPRRPAHQPVPPPTAAPSGPYGDPKHAYAMFNSLSKPASCSNQAEPTHGKPDTVDPGLLECPSPWNAARPFYSIRGRLVSFFRPQHRVGERLLRGAALPIRHPSR